MSLAAIAIVAVLLFIVDGKWSVVGSTNLDNRSFGLNDEVNVAILQERRRRPLAEKIGAAIGRVLERQA